MAKIVQTITVKVPNKYYQAKVLEHLKKMKASLSEHGIGVTSHLAIDHITSDIHCMKDESVAISEQTFTPPANANPDIERLARETRMPRELVARLYTSVRAKLERTARIKTYVPVLIHRHVKALLREQQHA